MYECISYIFSSVQTNPSMLVAPIISKGASNNTTIQNGAPTTQKYADQ